MASFNPVKETESKSRVVWSTISVNKAIEALAMGKRLKANPFYDNNINLLKGDINFEHTEEEIEKWKYYSIHINEFVEDLVKTMTPKGRANIILRDYQKDYFDLLLNNRLTIMLSARQAGKCICLRESALYRLPDGTTRTMNGFELLDYLNIHQELIKVKESRSKVKGYVEQLGGDKIVESHITNLEVQTHNGFEKVLYFHLIRPQHVYAIRLDNGLTLTGADNHKIISSTGEVCIKDSLGCIISTIKGPSQVVEVIDMGIEEAMYDLTTSGDQLYYTSGILSHNTVTSALFILHYICFNVDKNCIVIGNRGKTAKEVLSKLKDMFESLPHWVKPGVNMWNVTEVSFDNGCRIITDTTTEKPALGFTLHLCLWDEAAHVKESIATEFYANLFPTLQAANGKMMITSTQNGYNLFYRLYKAAEAGESSYKSFVVDWFQIPEWDPDKGVWYKRDEAWKNRQIANLGSEE